MKDAILPTLMQVGRGGRAGGSVAVCSLGSSRPSPRLPPPPPGPITSLSLDPYLCSPPSSVPLPFSLHTCLCLAPDLPLCCPHAPCPHHVQTPCVHRLWSGLWWSTLARSPPQQISTVSQIPATGSCGDPVVGFVVGVSDEDISVCAFTSIRQTCPLGVTWRPCGWRYFRSQR